MKEKRRLRYPILVVLVAVVGLGAAFAPVFSKLDYAQFPRRATWQLPERVLSVLELQRGDQVADIGAGDGYFTFRLADAVGPRGRVYAVEVDEEAVRELREEVDSGGYGNVEVVLAEPHDPGLPDGEIDLAFVCNVYHHIDDRVSYFDRLRQDLRPAGRVVLLEPRAVVPLRWLSPPGHATPVEALHQDMQSAHYRPIASFEFLPVQNFVIFSPLP